MKVHALVLKPPKMNVVEFRVLDKRGQLNINFVKPVNLCSLSLQIGNPVRLEPVSHINQHG